MIWVRGRHLRPRWDEKQLISAMNNDFESFSTIFFRGNCDMPLVD